MNEQGVGTEQIAQLSLEQPFPTDYSLTQYDNIQVR